jgi:hypothetical protein
VIAPITLLAVAPLEEVADLRLVDALRDAEIDFSMCIRAILIVASSGQECPAELGFL